MTARLDCLRAPGPVAIDGDLSKPAWRAAAWSPPFVDMVDGRPATQGTRAACLWDDRALYVAFDVEERDLAASADPPGGLVFQENDVEILIDGGDCYYEFELNALGVTYEVFFIWRDAHRRGGRLDLPEFDLMARDAYGFAGDHDRTGEHFWRGTHPRGPRWAFRDWRLAGLEVAVRLDGTLNDPSDVDRGWTAEVALPWAGLRHLAGPRPLPPRPGDEWRVFLGRFQRQINAGRPVLPHPASVVAPHGMYDTHRPELWPVLTLRSA